MTDLLEPKSPPAPALRLRPAPAVSLLSIGTASPPTLSQQQATDLAESFTCTTPAHRAWLKRVFSRAGVNHRGTVLKTGPSLDSIREFYAPPTSPSDRGPTTAARMARYALEAPPLAARAAQSALDNAGLAPLQISHLITVTCTGFFAPGLDVALINSLGLPPTVHRLHLGFMGCHAAFNALAAAADIVRANPSSRILVVAVELSTLHFAYGFHPEKLVANALFADGASATVVGMGGTGSCTHVPVPHMRSTPIASPLPESPNSKRETQNWKLRAASSLLLPNSQSAMTWHIGDHGFEMSLSAELPSLIASHIRPWITAFLSENHLALPDIQHWAIHPGGPKILNAAATALALPPHATHHSESLLASQGNMSSATLLFLLQKIAAENPAPALCLAIGFGPGLIAEALLLEI